MTDLPAFWERMRTGKELPTTSQPSIGDFLGCYEPLLQDGHDILSIHLSAGISGTYDSALQARAQLIERGLEAGRLAVLDSRTVCGGLGPAAARRRRVGARRRRRCRRSPRTPPRRARTCASGSSLDTLEYLRRGGRVGGAQAWIGGALKIKPILSLESDDRAGRARAHGGPRVRADGRVHAHAARRRRRRAGACSTSRPPAEAQRLVERGIEIFGCEPRFVGEVGPGHRRPRRARDDRRRRVAGGRAGLNYTTGAGFRRCREFPPSAAWA